MVGFAGLGLALAVGACAPSDGAGIAFLDVAAPDALPVREGPAPGAFVCPGPFTWLVLTTTAAERTGLPSFYSPDDTRAGSVNVQLNGGHGFGANETDPAFAAGFATLRNGSGSVIEELQLNRRYRPGALADDGCHLTATRTAQCWLPVDSQAERGLLEGLIPWRVRDSNHAFDDGEARVTVGASVLMDLRVWPPRSNDHETVRFTWDAPRGLDSARLLLRGSYQPAPDSPVPGSAAFSVPLLRSGWGEANGAALLRVPFVREVVRDERRLTVEVRADEALAYLCGRARDCRVKADPLLRFQGDEAGWVLRNEGSQAVVFDVLHVSWPATNGAVEEIRLDDTVLRAEPLTENPARLETLGLAAPLSLAGGEHATLWLRFTERVSADSAGYHARLDTSAGCVVEADNLSCRAAPFDCRDGAGMPLALSLRYAGGSCYDSFFAQDPQHVFCEGDPKFASPVRVVVTDGDEPVELARPWVDNVVRLDGAFRIDPGMLGALELPRATRIQLFRPGTDELLHQVEFLTGCGVTLLVGDRFGSLLVDDCVPASGS
jgi:hypothetical protein